MYFLVVMERLKSDWKVYPSVLFVCVSADIFEKSSLSLPRRHNYTRAITHEIMQKNNYDNYDKDHNNNFWQTINTTATAVSNNNKNNNKLW